MTVDTWDLGWRTRDLDHGFFPFINGIGVQIGLEDRVAHQKLGFDPLAANATAEQKQMAALYHTITTSRGVSPVWSNLWKLRAIWGDAPILLKGVQSVDDARAALEWGLDGVIVSNVSVRVIYEWKGVCFNFLNLTTRSTAAGKLTAPSLRSMHFPQLSTR